MQKKTILERPDTRSVLLGGKTHVLGEMRPCDIPAVMDFVEGAADGAGFAGLIESYMAKDSDRLLERAKALGRSQPKAVCELLVAILDKDPMGEDDSWRKAKLAELMALPLTELTTALGAWIGLNAPFFERQVFPLCMASAEVLALVNERMRALGASPGGELSTAGSALS